MAATAAVAASGLLAQVRFDHLQKDHLPEVRGSVVQFFWLDLDNDGDVDLLPIGDSASALLRTAPLRYSATSSPIPGSFRHRAAVMADFDGDGDLDVAIARDATNRVYRNTGNFTFVDDTQTALGFNSFDARAVAAGDVDGDGDADLVFGSLSAPDVLWSNDGTGRFTAVTNALVGASNSPAVALLDLDGDGDLDLVRGSDTGNTTAMSNNGAGVFTASATPLPADGGGTLSILTGDVDADGDVDLVIGKAAGGCKLLLAQGGGVFVDASSRLPASLPKPQRTILFDLDRDGDLDLAFTSTRGTVLLQNDATSFRNVSSRLPAVDGIGFGLGAADADSDGDLDLFVGSGRLMLFVNERGGREFVDASGANIDLVQACSRLADIDGDGDLDLLTAPNGAEAIGAVHVNDGKGRLVDDTAARWSPTGLQRTFFGFAVGDVDRDGDVDLVVGQSGQDRLYLNDGRGVFAEATATHLPVDTDRTTALVLADLDNDGDLDLAAANSFQANRVWRNDGTGHFAAAPGAVPQDAFWSQSIATADIDNDNDLDLIVADQNTQIGSQARLYRNDGTGTFVDATAGRIPASNGFDGGIATGDIDGDGDVDFAALDAMYRNDGTGTFTDVTATNMPAAPGLEPHLVDLDDDGDPDLIGYQTLFMNDGTGQFADASASFAGSGFFGQVPRPYAIGDIDRDGDLDVVGSYDLFSNLKRQVSVALLPRVGGTFDLEVHAQPVSSASQSGAIVFLAARTLSRPLSIGSFGLLHCNPLTIFAADALAISATTGTAQRSWSIPNASSLAGFDFCAQALLMHSGAPSSWRFTNVVRETIVR